MSTYAGILVLLKSLLKSGRKQYLSYNFPLYRDMWIQICLWKVQVIFSPIFIKNTFQRMVEDDAHFESGADHRSQRSNTE